MAYKEVSRVEITEIIRRWQAGASIRGLSRDTVRRYFLAAENCGLARDRPPTESQLITLMQLNKAGPRRVTIPTEKVLEPWAEQIRQWIKEERLQLTRVQGLLVQRGCVVSYTSLRRFVGR